MDLRRKSRSSGSDVFSDDISAHGRYLYSGSTAPLSARLATKRQSEMLLKAVGFTHETVLDVGCGDGHFTKTLAETGRRIVGIDPSRKAVLAARSQADVPSNVLFLFDSLEELHNHGNRFDVAVLRGVLHHAHDPQGLLREVSEIADKIVILEPNGRNPVLKVIELLSPYHRTHGEQSFGHGTLSSWLSAAGYRVEVKSLGVLVPYFAPHWAAKILSRLEPAVERMPIVRQFLCGTVVIEATVLDDQP